MFINPDIKKHEIRVKIATIFRCPIILSLRLFAQRYDVVHDGKSEKCCIFTTLNGRGKEGARTSMGGSFFYSLVSKRRGRE